MKKLYIFALVATMFAACATDAIDEQSVKVEELAPETLTVSFEEADSRIQLNEAGKTVWTKGDEVSVFYLSNANQKWQYQGETGERTGNLKRANVGNATETMKRVVVVYPYNENYYINTDTYNVKAWLPATQTYLKDSYGLDGNIMISQSEYNQFSLKNVCGWLKIQLTGNGEKVQSITLRGNNDEQVAGEIYISSADATSSLAADMGGADDNENSAGGNLVFDNTILTEVTLNCGEGVTLSSEATAFYIALPPQTFEKGLTIDIKDIDGRMMTKSTSNEITINRNAILPMAKCEFSTLYKISYTATAGDIIWNYADDANSDAGLQYTSRNIHLSIMAVDGNLDGYEYGQVVSKGILQTVEISCNGQSASDVVAEFGGTDTTPTLQLSRFQWGKTYNISAVYTLNNCEIEITTAVRTIDRSRRIIYIDLADESIDIATSLEFTTTPEDISQKIAPYLYEFNIGNMPIEAYLKENLITQKVSMYNYASYVNGMHCPNTMLTIDYSGQYIYAWYSYRDFSATPRVLEYVCDVTTWYGQRIQFRKNIYINTNLGIDFVHDPIWVYYADTYFSRTLAHFYYNYNNQSANLYAIEMMPFRLDVAFMVVDKNGDILDSQELMYRGIITRFEIEDPNISGWSINNNYDLIQLCADTEYVNVRGRLFMPTGIGQEIIELPSESFSTGGLYENFKVYSFNPIETNISCYNEYIVLRKGELQKYDFNLWQLIGFKDWRGFELIDRTKGDWIVGNDNNGFAMGYSVKDIYGLESSFELEPIPNTLANAVAFDSSGILSIDYYDDSLFQNPYVFVVKVHLKNSSSIYPITQEIRLTVISR